MTSEALQIVLDSFHSLVTDLAVCAVQLEGYTARGEVNDAVGVKQTARAVIDAIEQQLPALKEFFKE